MMKQLPLILSLAACSLTGKTGDSLPGGGGGGDTALSDTMADAPVVGSGSTIRSAAACNGSGFARVDLPPGQAFTVTLGIEAPADACLGFAYTNENGNTVDGSVELCSADLPKTLELTAREGGGYLMIGETGACQGATVTVAIE